MITSILRHELRLAINNRKTWYCVAMLQASLGLIFNWLLTGFLKTQASTQIINNGITEEVIHPFYGWFALLMLLFMPMITTQSICAEKQHGTIVNYYCSPVTASQVIWGKFLSLNVMLLLSMLLISIMPLTILISGSLDWGQFFATLLGLYLMLSAATAVALCVSTFMHNIIRSNILIFFALGSLVMLEWAAQYLGKHALFVQSFGLLNPLKLFLAGIINVQCVAFYLSLMVCFLILSSWRLTRRWHDV